ncbi:MAG: AAA family ATPase [bacterium]|nr:AAA family ATPase [bacterium]
MSTKPVYFLDLSVENVACFGDKQTLDLSDGKGKPARWTVILGDNGTGKTTLLKCLVYMEPLDEPFKITGQGSSLNYSPKMRYPILIEKIIYNPFLPLKMHTEHFYSGRLMEDKIDVFEGYGLTILDVSEDPEEPIKYETTVSVSKNLNLKNLIMYSYGALRRSGKAALAESTNQDNSASLFLEDVNLINAEEWLLQAYFASIDSDEDSRDFTEKRYNKIKQLLIDILPDVEDIRVKPITKIQLKPAMEAKTPYNWVGVDSLSLGYQALIAWMIDLGHRLFERYPDSDDPLAEPAVVLVDEIDIHLHPKWQRNLISHLTDIFKQTQFIVTAHSPLIVQSAQEANIVLLKREGDQVKIYNRKDKEVIQGWRVDQVLTSDLFELDSARPQEYDKYFERKKEILAKPQLSEEDKKELIEIGEKLEEFPVEGENRKLTEIIKKTVKTLEEKGKNDQD